MAYSAGLRVSEILNLKPADIDSDRMFIHIKNSKGQKDRYVPLSSNLLNMLKNYYRVYEPKVFLFEGQKGGKYSPVSMNKIVKQALKRSNINKNISTHSLRHSYATHLLETGTDIRIIKDLLGHNNITTTMLYTQIADRSILQVKSPFDD